MLQHDDFARTVAARVLDFCGAETAWQRRLWDVGTCLTLRETVEAANAAAERALSAEAVRWLRVSALALAGPDVGIGTPAERASLAAALKDEVTKGSFSARVIEQIEASAIGVYLTRWAAAVERGNPPPVGAERLARAIAGHLLGAGFSPDYLHRWWSYRIHHEQGDRTLSDILSEAHELTMLPANTYTVIVPLRRATARVHEIPGWLPPAIASDVLVPLNQKPVAGLAGALRLEVPARDDGAAVEAAAELVDRYVARITLGGGGERLEPLPFVWVENHGNRRRALRRRRGLEIPVLLRRDEPITTSVAPRVDSSLELLGPVDQGPAASAAAGAWAAVETLLTAPGDRGKIDAADRLAALVACSFPRAELGQLGHRFVERDAQSNEALATALENASTNTERARLLAHHLRVDDIAFSDASDSAACLRMKTLIDSPRTGLGDLEKHIQRALRRLYRVRNLVLHGAATDSVALAPALRAAAPLVGAGLDRLVRGAVLHGVDPLDLAVKARIMIDNADNLPSESLGDLLELAEP